MIILIDRQAAEKEITSPENIYHTANNLGRPGYLPSMEELTQNYDRFSGKIRVTIHAYSVSEAERQVAA